MISRRKSVFNVLKILLCLTFTQVIIPPFSYIFYVFVCFYLLVYGILRGSKVFFINKQLSKFLLFYNSPFLISLVVSLPIAYFINEHNLYYDQLFVIGRVLNITIFSLVILSAENLDLKEREVEELIKAYWIGCLLLVFTGVWQAISKYVGYIPFPFDTRSHVHGATGQDFHLDFRLTGLAQEPSYFVISIVDFIGISFFYLKKKWKYICLTLGLLILYLTFSPSGYLLFLLCFSLTFVGCTIKFGSRIQKILVFFLLSITLVMSSSLLHFLSSNYALDYVSHRINTASNSGRFFILFEVINLLFNSSGTTILFGLGIKSFSLLPSILPISAETSNNFYVDILVEAGILGFSLLLCFYLYVLRKVLHIKSIHKFGFALFLFCTIVVSSFFKADYASFRSFMTLYFIFLSFKKSTYDKQ